MMYATEPSQSSSRDNTEWGTDPEEASGSEASPRIVNSESDWDTTIKSSNRSLSAGNYTDDDSEDDPFAWLFSDKCSTFVGVVILTNTIVMAVQVDKEMYGLER